MHAHTTPLAPHCRYQSRTWMYYRHGDRVACSGFHLFDLLSQWREWICKELRFDKMVAETMHADVAYYDDLVGCWVRVAAGQCSRTPFRDSSVFIVLYPGEEPRRIERVQAP